MKRYLAGAALAGALLAPPAAPAAEAQLRMTAAQLEALGVQTVVLEQRAAGSIEGLPAQVVVPNNQVQVVSAPLPALVERVLVATQQPVAQGQLLARLRSPELADLQHSFLQAATQASLARANLERDESLHAEGIIAESRLLAARAHRTETSADLAERTQALRMAGMSQAEIDRLRAGHRVGTVIELRAPIAGVVLEQLAYAGQRLDAAAPVLKIARLEPLWLEIQLPVARLAEVRQGAAVSVPAQHAAGRVIAIGRSVSEANQTVMVRAEVERNSAALRPGQFVEASIAAAGGEAQWSVPTAAVARVKGRAVVFVRSAEGFRAQPVSVLNETAAQAVVSGELEAGERIAVKGVAALKAALVGIGVE